MNSAVETAYPDDYYGSTTAKFTGVAGDVRRHWHGRRARKLALMLADRPSPSVYDIGCGDGEFLAACRARGFSVHGCEPVPRPRDQAIRRLDRPIDAEAFSGEPDRLYDVITAWQVIEHVADPASILLRAREHLSPDGVLAVSTVNLDSLQARLFGPNWLHLDPPRHLWVGGRSAVESLVDRCGFKIVDRVWNQLEFGPIGYVDSMINLVDTRRDRLLHCLKTGFSGFFNKCLWFSAAALTPLGIALSTVEAAFARPSTFELYAKPDRSDA